MVQAQFPLTLLDQTQEELSSLLGVEGTDLWSVGRETRRNRVSLGLGDPTDEGWAMLEEAAAGLPVCFEAGQGPVEVGEG